MSSVRTAKAFRGGSLKLARARSKLCSSSAAALHDALEELLADRPALARMAESARAAAVGAYAWEGIAARTLALYESLLSENHNR